VYPLTHGFFALAKLHAFELNKSENGLISIKRDFFKTLIKIATEHFLEAFKELKS